MNCKLQQDNSIVKQKWAQISKAETGVSKSKANNTLSIVSLLAQEYYGVHSSNVLVAEQVLYLKSGDVCQTDEIWLLHSVSA